MSSWDFGGSGSSTPPGDSWGSSTTPAPRSPSLGSDWGQSPSGDPNSDIPSGLTGHGVPPGDLGGGSTLIWLFAALTVAVISIVLELLTNSYWTAAVAWLLAGPVTITLLAVVVRLDTAHRANPWYAESPLVNWGRRVVVALALIGVTASAWSIADAVSRSNW